jgi:small subunit ribosomal protein S8
MTLQSTDPIADLLTRIRNALLVGKNEVRMPSSKLKLTVAKELVKARYLIDAKIEPAKPRNELVVTINNPGENPTINEIVRMSKPGRRMYVSSKDIPRVMSGRGIVLLSTSRGVVNGNQAKKQKIGGELLLKVY